jgi:glyoxylase-like metal-dependent hydrolase (beta-lactamase superfamily II)
MITSTDMDRISCNAGAVYRSERFLRPSGSGTRSGVQWVANGLACLRLPIVNVYFLADTDSEAGSWVLVDAGLRGSVRKIKDAARSIFGDLSPVAIVLTHGHFDHVGALAELAELWDAPVYAHPLEMPYLTGQSNYPPPDPAVGGGVMSTLSRFFPRGPINLGDRVRPLPFDGSLPYLPEWRWVHTPGHTPGHVSLFRESDRVLIAGDAFVTVKQESALSMLKRPARVYRPPAYYTTDWPAAFGSVNKLAKLEPQFAVTGHGLPIHGESLRRGLEKLGGYWDGFVPSRGRYVQTSAVSNENGVEYVPPAVTDVRLIAYTAIGVAAIAGGIYVRSVRTACHRTSRMERARDSLSKLLNRRG